MSDTIVEIRIPAPLSRLGLSRQEVQQRVNEWLVLSLFTEGRISSGKAASLLETSRVEFLALLRQRGIAYIDYSEEELAEEIAAAASFPVEREE